MSRKECEQRRPFYTEKENKSYLVDDTASTDVQVSDFGIAHETIGKTDVETVGAEGGVGVLLLELVHVRGFGVEDGVATVVLFGGDTPAIDDDADDVVLDLGSHVVYGLSKGKG